METADMLTDLIQNFLNKNIGELEDKNILITLPNKKRIELGNHHSSLEITFCITICSAELVLSSAFSTAFNNA